MFRRSLFLFALLLAAANCSSSQRLRIAGTVVDSVSGAPLDRAEVLIAPVSNLEDTQTSLTASNGQFVFSNLAPGKYRLSATRPGYTSQGLDEHEGFMTAIAVGPKLDSEHVRFALSRDSVLAGSVVSDFGDPVRDASVFLFQRKLFSGSRAMRLVSRAATDDLGNYRFAHLHAGTYAVAVYAKPWYALPGPLVDFGGENSRIVFMDGPSLPASSDSEPPATPPVNSVLNVAYPILFYPNAGSLETATPLSLTPGTTLTADFSLHAVPAIRLLVKVPYDSSQDARTIEWESDPSDHTSNTVQERVRPSGQNFEASLKLPGVDDFNLDTIPDPHLPDTYEVLGVPPGEISLSLASREKGQILTQSKKVQISSDGQIDLVSRGPSVLVTGEIPGYKVPRSGDNEDAGSDPNLIQFTSADGNNSYAASLDAAGHFTLSVPAGQYRVEFSAESGLFVNSVESKDANVSAHTVTLASAPVKLVVRLVGASCTVTGTALKNGQPFAGAMILLVPEDASQNAALFHRDQSDSDGTFTLGNVLPGRYTLLAIEHGWDLEWSTLSVLFQYLPSGIPVTLKPAASVSANPKVQ